MAIEGHRQHLHPKLNKVIELLVTHLHFKNYSTSKEVPQNDKQYHTSSSCEMASRGRIFKKLLTRKNTPGTPPNCACWRLLYTIRSIYFWYLINSKITYDMYLNLHTSFQNMISPCHTCQKNAKRYKKPQRNLGHTVLPLFQKWSCLLYKEGLGINRKSIQQNINIRYII